MPQPKGPQGPQTPQTPQGQPGDDDFQLSAEFTDVVDTLNAQAEVDEHAREDALALDEALGSVNEVLGAVKVFKQRVTDDTLRLLRTLGLTRPDGTIDQLSIDGLDNANYVGPHRAPGIVLTPVNTVTVTFSTSPAGLRQQDFGKAEQTAPPFAGSLASAAEKLISLGCNVKVTDNSVTTDDHLSSASRVELKIPLRVLFDRRSYAGQGVPSAGNLDASGLPGAQVAPQEQTGQTASPGIVAAPATHVRGTATAVQEALGAGVGC